MKVGLGIRLEEKFLYKEFLKKDIDNPYKWFIEREHVNIPQEILGEIQPYFKLVSREFFSFKIFTYTWCNISIGLNFKLKKLYEITN